MKRARERETAEKAMLIIMSEMREKREKGRAVWSPYSLLRIIACMLAGADREREREESEHRAAVTPLWFHSTSCLLPQCLCVLSPGQLPIHKYQRSRREGERDSIEKEKNKDRPVKVKWIHLEPPNWLV